jgi:hypothetical protein
MLKRGRAALAALALAAVVASLMILPAAASPGIGITYTGPVQAGTQLTLSCPEGYTAGSGEADFYRDPQMRVAVALNVSPDIYILWPDGHGYKTLGWTVPRGARYADAVIQCFEVPPTFSFVKTGVFDGTSVTFFCPSSHPYFVDGVVYGDEDANFDTFPQYVIPYEVLRDPDGIVFTGPVGHAYRATITCTSETLASTTTTEPTTTLEPTTTTTPPTTTTIGPATSTVVPTTTT